MTCLCWLLDKMFIVYLSILLQESESVQSDTHLNKVNMSFEHRQSTKVYKPYNVQCTAMQQPKSFNKVNR